MIARTQPSAGHRGSSRAAQLRTLVGSGDKIMLLTAPFAVVGVAMNIAHPDWFEVGGPPATLRAISIIALIPGIVIWAWSIILILRKVPRGELITSGPFSLVKHPLYTAVALLVLPWLGFLLNTWLGAAIGLILYGASRRYAPEEEAALARTFPSAWERYRQSVKIPWV